MEANSAEMTGLLLAWQDGDDSALERLMPLIHRQLARLAGKHFGRERTGHTLQPTALVNEAYLRLINQKKARWQSRAHFFAIASRMMRRILVDYSRRRGAEKRHGQMVSVTLDQALELAGPAGAVTHIDLLHLDRALVELARLDGRQCRVVELRFFGGLTIAETADVLAVSPATIKVDWQMAKAWLFNRLSEG